MERLACEFFLIRYVPDVVKGEFTNIGVVLRKAGPSAGGAAAVRFTRDWSRVRCMDADADVGLLESLEGEIAARLRSDTGETKLVMELLSDTLSNALQVTPVKACLAESMAAEMEQLMRMYVEPLKVKVERKRTGRAAIAGAMRTEFERAGVWGLMRKRIAAATYTRAGDPMRIDCGYRVGVEQAGADGLIRMFQAVSLEGDVETAKVLAYSAPQLRDGVARVERARLELTAVVEPLRLVSFGKDAEEDADEATERYRFGVEAMERQEIRVMTVNDLARMAETARAELRV
ncbi:DUF3037 domain-containing protein [Granulicella sp. dw_53]|uniref:DUF3037 domain-containing protein n=1 Tax=Granulicella sp. dw_53 TaxID=2719792 RepID=UPI0031F61D2A